MMILVGKITCFAAQGASPLSAQRAVNAAPSMLLRQCCSINAASKQRVPTFIGLRGDRTRRLEAHYDLPKMCSTSLLLAMVHLFGAYPTVHFTYL